jgi:hypothetical protein
MDFTTNTGQQNGITRRTPHGISTPAKTQLDMELQTESQMEVPMEFQGKLH